MDDELGEKFASLVEMGCVNGCGCRCVRGREEMFRYNDYSD